MLGICKAVGEIDAVTGAAFGVLLRDAIDGSDEPLVSVDCTGVTFMDPAGYHALVDATQYAARRGHTLVIRNVSTPCARLLRFYDWDRELRVEHPTLRAEPIRGDVSLMAHSCVDAPKRSAAGAAW